MKFELTNKCWLLMRQHMANNPEMKLCETITEIMDMIEASAKVQLRQEIENLGPTRMYMVDHRPGEKVFQVLMHSDAGVGIFLMLPSGCLHADALRRLYEDMRKSAVPLENTIYFDWDKVMEQNSKHGPKGRG